MTIGKYTLCVFLTLALSVLAACGGGGGNPPDSVVTDEHDHSHEADSTAAGRREEAQEDGEHAHEDLQVSSEKQKLWGIIDGQAVSQSVSSVLSLPGTLAFNQNKTAYISSFSPGKVVDLPLDLGSRVRRGQVLAVINSPEFGQAQADFLEARARLSLAEKEYERAKRLLEEKAIEEKEYQRREAEYEKASTEYGAFGSALHSFGLDHGQIDALMAKADSLESAPYKCEIANPLLSLLSPLSGTIVQRDAIIGQHIESDKILYTVSDLDHLWAELDAFEKDLPFLKKGASVSITTSVFPDRAFRGTITYISDAVDERARTIGVRAEIDNGEGLLKPNMFIQGRIENTDDGREFLAVPDDAVQNLNGEKIVFIRETSDVFAVRHVVPGDLIDDRRIILGGITGEDRIVLKGAFKLKTELTKSSVGTAHVH